MRTEDLIPRPRKIVMRPGRLDLRHGLRLECGPGEEAADKYLRKRLGCALVDSGLPIRLAASPQAGGEAYRLSVLPEEIRLEGSRVGLLRGAVTLCQILDDAGETTAGTVPCCEIEDEPAFAWRGLMIDCSRHFISIDYLVRLLDIMAELKLNRLHLHLVDDQGWRMQIESHPKLTAMGAFVEDDPRRRGLYTKAELRGIVQGAGQLGIEVVPEIEVPGHSFAAMLSYPELSCTRLPQRNPGHQKDLYCAGREATFRFLEDVLTEVLDVFPFEYVHLGGDEAPKDRWRACPDCQSRIRDQGLSGEERLQGYMFRRLSDFLESQGRRAIGWEEILDGSPSRDTVVHWWRYRTHGDAALRKALAAGRRVIASPNSFMYLSFPVSPNEHFRPERTSDLAKVYSARYVPVDVNAEARALVLGAECCIWTEYLVEEQIDAMLFPRVLACAELMWTDPADRDLGGFRRRVGLAEDRWRRLGVVYGPDGAAAGDGSRPSSQADEATGSHGEHTWRPRR
jgi:hexosaminidase